MWQSEYPWRALSPWGILVKLVEYLDNLYTQEKEIYPKTISDTYKILTNCKQGPRNMLHMVQPATNRTEVNLVFVNVYGNKYNLTGTSMVLVAGKYGCEHQNIMCCQFHNTSHYACICPEKVEKSKRLQLLVDGFAVEDVHGF